MTHSWSRTPGRQRAAILHASLAAASLPTILQRTDVGRGHCTHWRGPLVDSHFSRASMLGTCCRTRARLAQPLCQEQPKTKGPFKQLLRAQKYPEVDAGFWQPMPGQKNLTALWQPQPPCCGGMNNADVPSEITALPLGHKMQGLDSP